MIKYYDKVSERSGKNLFWPIKISNEVLNKLNPEVFVHVVCPRMICLYTTLPHNLIKETVNDLTE